MTGVTCPNFYTTLRSPWKFITYVKINYIVPNCNILQQIDVLFSEYYHCYWLITTKQNHQSYGAFSLGLATLVSKATTWFGKISLQLRMFIAHNNTMRFMLLCYKMCSCWRSDKIPSERQKEQMLDCGRYDCENHYGQELPVFTWDYWTLIPYLLIWRSDETSKW